LTDEYWKIDELIEVVWKEVEAHESSEGTKIKPQVTPQPVPLGLKVNVFTEVVSTTQHLAIRSGLEDILIKGGHCFDCLKHNYKTRDCLSQRACRIFYQRQNQSICDNLSVEAKQFVPLSTYTNNCATN